MEKKCTLKDLAKILNLAISTVSKAINNSPEISEMNYLEAEPSRYQNNRS